jgi:hypothetical protein
MPFGIQISNRKTKTHPHTPNKKKNEHHRFRKRFKNPGHLQHQTPILDTVFPENSSGHEETIQTMKCIEKIRYSCGLEYVKFCTDRISPRGLSGNM